MRCEICGDERKSAQQRRTPQRGRDSELESRLRFGVRALLRGFGFFRQIGRLMQLTTDCGSL